jgi:Domain of unknown function (DUF4258)
MSDFTILWDLEDDPEGNVQHIAEHDISVEEVEDVLRNGLNKTERSRQSGLPMTFGWTFTGRHIAVVWELANRDPKMVYPVTAYCVDPRSR